MANVSAQTTAADVAARMGARAGKAYLRTGVSGPTPFDTSPDAPPRLRDLTVAYCRAYCAELPKPTRDEQAGKAC
jgi:hypothetical protein